MYGETTPARRRLAAVHYLGSVRDMGIAMGLSPRQREHARRVLSLLVRVTEELDPEAGAAALTIHRSGQFDVAKASALSRTPQLAERLSDALAETPGRLWEREAERSERFDAEGFESFTEITAHAALAREAAERKHFSRGYGAD